MALYQRGKNWYIDFTFHGQRVREMIGPSRKGAENVIAKKKAEIAENKFLDVRKDPDPIKFHEFAKEFLEWARVNHKASSRTRELSNMRSLEEAFNNKNIHEITTWDIERWKVKKKGEVKPATVNRELATLKSMLSKAVEWGKIKESPTRKVKPLKGVTKRLRYLMPDEVQRLISNCSDHLKPIVIVAVHTGMRKGEVLSLRWEQIDFEKGIITLVDTKNDQRRYVPMDETVKSTLMSMERKSEYAFCGKKPGRPLVWVELSFHNALEKSGIEDFKIHDLRHTFASNLVMSGVDLMTVKELLGHKTIEMTLRYAHLAPDHKMRAVNILDQVMSQNPPQEERQERKVLEFKR
jgi:integrase